MLTLRVLVPSLWTVLALLNGWLAEQKDEPPSKWFLISVLLGPLATILILARPRVDQLPPGE